MASSQAFLSRLVEARDAVKHSALKEATIVHHDEADGLTSAALAKIALEQIGLETRLVCLDKLYPEVVNDLEAGSRKIIVYADIGSAHVDLIGKANKSANLILTLDHHDTLARDDPLVYNLNPELYGFTGERDAPSATVAYLFAKTVSSPLIRYSGLAVIGSMEIPGEATGLNNLVWEDAIQTQVLSKSTDHIRINLGEVETSPARASTMLNVLGSVGYYRNGPAMGVGACEHGFSRAILDVARKLEDERKAANRNVMRRLVVEGLFQKELVQWFHAQDTYEGMSGKVVGSFCSYLKFQRVTDPGKYLIGMMNVPREIPGWGLLSTRMVKVSGRAPPRLAVQIQKGVKPPLSKIMGDSCARVGGFGDGHSIAASGVIPVGREGDFLEALNAMAQGSI
ncbi:MAG TPA: DHH family phosphoesterase [Candidatus Bathyarchaeia archaeon]|nr:DHH family phosphoesterase [Candidatus Bathyarchaeia archaeon]